MGRINTGGSKSALITSIQRGEVTLPDAQATQTITITGVNLLKSIARVTCVAGTATQSSSICLAIEFLSSTSIRISREGTVGTVTFAWEVIEFDGVKSLQKGTTSGGDVTVSSVNVNKSLLFNSYTNSNASVLSTTMKEKARIVNSTTINITDQGASTHYWQLIEFK